ncbi:MAG: hypothetical protein Tsb009_38910 [Planctomycetaceae bacterium]
MPEKKHREHAASDSGAELTVSLLKRYRNGDQTAAAVLHDRFAGRLRRLAAQLIGSRFLRRVDADDALQSAFRTFFLRSRSDQFSISQTGQLWHLLVRITSHKVRKVVERHTAQRRDIRCEQLADGSLPGIAAEYLMLIRWPAPDSGSADQPDERQERLRQIEARLTQAQPVDEATRDAWRMSNG